MKQARRRGLLFCLCGPTGGGKTFYGMRLLQAFPDSLTRSVSVTSREPRAGETHAQSYYFISRNEFEHRIAKGEFFEWEEVHGNYYGTLMNTIKSVPVSGKDLMLVIDIRGALRVKEAFPEDTIIAFMVPPDFKTLKDRLRARGKMSNREEALRFETARFEYARLLEHADRKGHIDYLVVNDEIEPTFAAVSSILQAERARLHRIDRDEVEKICHTV